MDNIPRYSRNGYLTIIAGVLVAFVVTALLVGCGDDQQPEKGAVEQKPIDTADVAIPEREFIKVNDNADYRADFMAAVEQGDLRFVGVMGYAMTVPGVPDYYDKYDRTNGVKVIEGTSDTFSYEDTVGMRRDTFCRIYAKNYNTLLLAHLDDKRAQWTPQ